MADNVGQQFAQWDADEDGKVYPAEIAASYMRALAPQATQVVANVVKTWVAADE